MKSNYIVHENLNYINFANHFHLNANRLLQFDAIHRLKLFFYLVHIGIMIGLIVLSI